MNHPSAQSVANQMGVIKSRLKKVQFFMGDNNTQKMMTSNDKHLTFAIADLNIYEGLSFNLSQKPRFNKVLDLARTVSKCYQPPNI